MRRAQQPLIIRFALAACVPMLACASAATQEISSPEPEAPVPILELQRLPPAVAALPSPLAPEAAEQGGIGNADVLEMANAEFSDSTIIAAFEANETRFDVSPRALLSLKAAGVSERVIEAMLAAEAAKKQAAAPALVTAAPEGIAAAQAPVEPVTPTSAPVSPETLAALTQAIEQLANAPAAAEPEPAEPAEPDESLPAVADHAPRAWVVDGDDRVALASTVAQVAFTDMKRTGATPFKVLQGFAERAMAFANPALALGDGLGGLFRSDDPTMTAVWALRGGSASRQLPAGTVFEIEFADIPGVNPDQYRPAIVQLVPTRDNYRLVGAAKTSESNMGGAPSGPIIEEPLAVELMPLARGHYRLTLYAAVPPGEYALVLRPVVQRARERRRHSEGTLGELMGGGSSHVLYTTWDFSIRP